MNSEQFWHILQTAYVPEDQGTLQDWFDSLRKELLQLPPEEIVEFGRHYDALVGAAYKTDLWGAAYVINGGCSDDGFHEFRSWLVGMGRDVYEKALADPDSLADVLHGQWPCHAALDAAAPRAWEEKTGRTPVDYGEELDKLRDRLLLLCHLWHPAGVRAHLTGMKTPTRIPQAPLEPLPALAEFLAPFRLHFARSEGPQALDRYLSGLLTEQPIKNCDTIAQVVPGTSAQQLQGLLTAMDWDHDDLNRQRVQRLQQMATEGDGVLIFDDTGFAKQGRCSVGVARQYSGTLGKVGNCQVTVNCHYAERTLGWPVATRLYLPQDWAENAGRRAKAGVPEEVAFRTKPEIALDLLDQAEAWGVRWACVVADADYGDNPNFLAGLEKRRQRYVVAVRCDFAVALSRRAGPVQRADPVIAAQPASAWRTVRWREGSKGWLRGRFVALRCWRVLANGRRRVGWLIGEQPGGDPAADRKYYWSNLRSQAGLATLVGYAHRRHWVEQYHEEAKGLLGWDQYQGRLWTGFHRHAVCVMLAYSFLVWQEWQQRPQRARRGRPRRAFSPSEGPAAGAAAGDPPAGVRLATPPRGQGVAAA